MSYALGVKVILFTEGGLWVDSGFRTMKICMVLVVRELWGAGESFCDG